MTQIAGRYRSLDEALEAARRLEMEGYQGITLRSAEADRPGLTSREKGTLFGALAGSLLGIALGELIWQGLVAIPGLSPMMSAGSASVVFIWFAILGSLGGLAGFIVASERERGAVEVLVSVAGEPEA